MGLFGVDPPESLLSHFRCPEIIWGSRGSSRQIPSESLGHKLSMNGPNLFILVDVSDIFNFFLFGEGEGEVRGAMRGGSF